jgi:ATP-binding cassette subfamily F protein uup
LFLLRVLMGAPNVLILDEPTNDLDVQTLAVLEEYLEDFNGCVIVVSHDRYFLDRTVDTIFALEEGGRVRQYPGNYSVYLDIKKGEEENQEGKTAEAQRRGGGEEKGGRSADGKSQGLKKLSFKEKREYETLEAQIPQMEEEKAAIEQRLYTDAPGDFTEVQRLTERLAELTVAIDAATERWLELAERLG